MPLEVPDNFDFPFKPYDIQHEFMKKLYEVLNENKFGIFESPTGTGKSLSIICGALRWLKDYNNHERKEIEDNIERLTKEKDTLAVDSSDWLISQSKEIQVTRQLNALKLENNKINDYYKKIDNLRTEKKDKLNKRFFQKNTKGEKADECLIEKEKKDDGDDDNLVLDEVIGSNVDEESDEEEEDKYSPVKIFICSRTHSQLAQFIGEIRKSSFATDVRVVSLASRQNYCINPDVTRLKSVNLINDRCLELQKSQSKSTKKDTEGKTTKKQKGSNCKCPYYKQQAIDDLRDLTLIKVQDIEDLVTNAKEVKGCPYYSSRKASEDAEVVLVPYNTILHKATREANGIKLKNNVVIIDEAHNLLEALAQMYGAEVSYEQLVHAHLQLKKYKMKFSKRFSAKNLLSINQLIFVISRLKEELEKDVKTEIKTKAQIFTLQNFVLNAEIDNYNMFNLVKFIKESRISQKLNGFAIKYSDELLAKKEEKKGIKSFLTSIENKKKGIEPQPEAVTVGKIKSPPSNPLLAVASFPESLTYSYSDGRILVHRDEFKKLQFLLLNSSSHFKDVVSEARSVIVAGGTMKPISEFRDRLFINAGADLTKIVEFSCDHIIPPENILPIIINSGVSGQKLLFNYENRLKMGEQLKFLLKDSCNSVKGGIVVFFPSYKYESWFWDKVKDIDFGRNVFREPKESGSVDSVLEQYSKAICRKDSRGAMMFSVVGGKLSEGLNFSDDLGRCVIVIGLPYPNIYAVDLREKMAFLDKTEGSGAGNKFYENLCMKAVNQCIGRAVRHKDDYATVILFDERYDRNQTKNALPDWIKRSLKSCNYDNAFDIIKKVYALGKNQKSVSIY